MTDTETVSEGKVIKSPEPLDFKVNSPVFNFGDYVNNNTLKDSTKNLVQDKINECDNNFKVIGTLFDTYILIEKDKNLLLIDQHAGHERILFDKFCKELENKQVAIQPLLVPYVLETNIVESNFINDNISFWFNNVRA